MSMTLTLLSNSVILNFKGKVVDAFDTAKAETKVKSLFADHNVRPVTASYPDAKSILIPEAGMQILGYEKRLLLTEQTADSKIDETHANTLYLQLATEMADLVSLPLDSCTLSFEFSINADDIDETVNVIQQKSGLASVLLPTKEFEGKVTLISALPTIVFAIGEVMYDVEFEIKHEPVKRVGINCLAYSTKIKFTLEELTDFYNSTKRILNRYIVDIQDS